MAANGNTVLTLADWAKRVDPDGRVDAFGELLTQTNEILLDMPWLEGNTVTGHRTTVRTGLPTATWRMLNYGVAPSKSTTAQITDTIGMLEAYSKIDKDLAMLNGNTAEFRLSEDRAFIESMNQTMAQTVFYGNSSLNPERFMGLAPRFNTVNTATAQTANNVIDAGGTGSDNTSVWFVCWGPNTVHGIFPKGSKAGLLNEDLGEDTLSDGNGGEYQGLRSHYQWKAGLTVRDWRYIVRICNIDVSDLNGGSGANLIKLMIRAMHRIPSMGMGKTVIYANRTVASWLDVQSLEKTNLALAYSEVQGVPVTTFRKVPIRTVDQILNTEARLT